MNCKKFEEKLSAYLDGELDYDARTELEAHLLECRECSEQLEEMRRIESFKPLLEPPKVPQEKWRECWEEIKKQTTDSLSAEKVRRSVASRRRAHYLRRVVFGLGSAAAVAILLAVVLLWPGETVPVSSPLPGDGQSICVNDYDESNYTVFVSDNDDYTIIKLIPVDTREGG